MKARFLSLGFAEEVRRARECMNTQKYLGIYKDLEMGIVSKNTGVLVGYRKGQVVLISNPDKEKKTCTVESPNPKGLVDRFEPNGGPKESSLTYRIVYNVPENCVERI